MLKFYVLSIYENTSRFGIMRTFGNFIIVPIRYIEQLATCPDMLNMLSDLVSVIMILWQHMTLSCANEPVWTPTRGIMYIRD